VRPNDWHASLTGGNRARMFCRGRNEVRDARCAPDRDKRLSETQDIPTVRLGTILDFQVLGAVPSLTEVIVMAVSGMQSQTEQKPTTPA
jgi:hypothetical protein